MKILHTDGQNIGFNNLCKLLDSNLYEIIGGSFQREKYNPYKLDNIKNAVIISIDGYPAASGSFKHYR